MTEDRRISKLREATEAMAAGDFRVALEAGEAASNGAADDVASLGAALARLGAALERRFAEMTTLSGLAEKINAGLLVEEILDHVFVSFQSIIPYDRIGFSFLEEEGRLVRAFWARSVASELKVKVGYAAPLAGSSLNQILETGRPRILNDLEGYLREHPESSSTRLIVEEGVRSSLTCPLVAMGKPIGFMFFSSFKPGTYASAHSDVFVQVAGHLSAVVEKGRLYQELVQIKLQLEQANQKLSELVMIDELTGVGNRRALDERLSVAWRRAVRYGSWLTVLMIDIDKFKDFNDRHGHPQGDACLTRVAGALQGVARRPGDFVGRYGGEEFMVVAEHTDLQGGAKLGELLRARVEALVAPGPEAGSELRVTISLGVAAAEPMIGQKLEDLVAAADRALYRAKEQGRNRVEVAPAGPARE